MKRYLFILFIIGINGVCFSQSSDLSKDGFQWYPEKAIFSAYIENSSANLRYSEPFEMFQLNDGSVRVRPLYGKITDIKTSRVDSNKVELIGVQKIFASDGVTRSPFSNYRYFLSKKECKLLLEVVKNNAIDSVYFINNLFGFKFTYPNETYPYLLIAGTYKASFISPEYLREYEGQQEETEFKLNGKVIGNSSIQGFKLLGIGRYSLSETFYLFNLELLDKQKNKDDIPIAFQYYPLEKKWKGYRFKKIGFIDIELLEPVIEMTLLTR